MSYVFKRKKTTYWKEIPYTVPELTENGTMGSSSFATANSINDPNGYKVFNGGANGTEVLQTYPNAAPQWLSFYSPEPIKISQLQIGQYKHSNESNNYYFTNFSIQACNDGESWKTIYNSTASQQGKTVITVSIPEANQGYYKYHRIYVAAANYWSGYPRVTFSGVSLTKAYIRKEVVNLQDHYWKYGEFTKVGAPTFNNDVVSGFSSANYLTLPQEFKPTEPFEMVFSFRLTNNTNQQTIIGQTGTNYLTRIEISPTNKIRFVNRKDNTGYVVEIIGTTDLLTNIDYWVKLEWDGSTYRLYLSTNGLDYTLEGQKDYSLGLTTGMTNIGYVHDTGGTNKGFPLFGSINLLQSYIKVGDDIWWQGTIEGTKDDYDFITYNWDYKIEGIDNFFARAKKLKYYKRSKNYDGTEGKTLTWSPKYQFYKTGAITIDENNLVSGLNNNYSWCVLPKIEVGENDTVECVWAFKVKTSMYDIICSDVNNYASINLDIISTLFVNGNNKQVILSENTDYLFKEKCWIGEDGRRYGSYYYSEDNGETWNIGYEGMYFGSNNNFIRLMSFITFGYPNSDYASDFTDSSIDLNKTYIKVNNKVVWGKGAEPISIPSDYDYTEVEEASFVVRKK